MSTVLFDQLKLSREIQSAVSDMGFEKATRIQADVIPVLLGGGDVVAQSETGSGKTVAFAVPMVERLSPS
jgi:ATP-dependent RNA helicase DeaD